MPLPALLTSIIGMLCKTTSIELHNFFKKITRYKAISKQSFSKARGNLNPEIFLKINELYIEEYYTEEYKTENDYILFACDGTGVEIPNVPELCNYFGFPKNQNGTSDRPVGNASVLYDLLNETIIHSILKPYGFSEKAMAIEHIKKIQEIASLKGKKLIILFDRGYPSMELITMLADSDIKFIMRSKKKYIKQTMIAAKNSKYDKVRKIQYTPHMLRDKPLLKKRSKEIGNQISLRFSSGRFSDGEIGVLISNLGEEFSREKIFELYSKRWKVEVSFKFLKINGELENFACKTILRLYQEFYAKMLTINFSTMYIELAQEEVDNKIKSGEIKSKHRLKVNKNIALGLIKEALPTILLGKTGKIRESSFNELIYIIAKHVVPVKDNRFYKRKFHVRKRVHNHQQRRAL